MNIPIIKIRNITHENGTLNIFLDGPEHVNGLEMIISDVKDVTIVDKNTSDTKSILKKYFIESQGVDQLYLKYSKNHINSEYKIFVDLRGEVSSCVTGLVVKEGKCTNCKLGKFYDTSAERCTSCMRPYQKILFQKGICLHRCDKGQRYIANIEECVPCGTNEVLIKNTCGFSLTIFIKIKYIQKLKNVCKPKLTQITATLNAMTSKYPALGRKCVKEQI